MGWTLANEILPTSGIIFPLFEVLYRYYFRVSARGFDGRWGGRPFIMVGNHNGGINSRILR